MITIDLKMDAAFIKENFQIKWVAETGFVENIGKLIKEYKAARNLIVCLTNQNCGFNSSVYVSFSRSKYACWVHRQSASLR